MQHRTAAALRAQAHTLLALADQLESQPANDELVAIGDLPERKAVERLVTTGKLRSVKLGRRRFVSRADLLGLLTSPPEPPKAKIYSLKDAVKARAGG